MTNIKSKFGTLPYQISELPEGVIVREYGRIEVGENAKGTIIIRATEVIDNGEKALIIEANRNSDVRIILLQNISRESDMRMKIECKADENARVHIIQFHLGGAKVGVIQTSETIGESAEINTNILSMVKQNQEHTFNISNVYNARNGRGQILMKGVALDEARLNMTGTIRITQKGTGADTYLKQDSLFLSKNAKISASPRLEIGTNDVKAGHGASVTNLNDENLIYLTSRGIAPDEARKMMIKGFITEMMDKIGDLKELRVEIEQLI